VFRDRILEGKREKKHERELFDGSFSPNRRRRRRGPQPRMRRRGMATSGGGRSTRQRHSPQRPATRPEQTGPPAKRPAALCRSRRHPPPRPTTVPQPSRRPHRKHRHLQLLGGAWNYRSPPATFVPQPCLRPQQLLTTPPRPLHVLTLRGPVAAAPLQLRLRSQNFRP
jgi:hypothetical protein